jgi:hypothetical protein
MQRETETQTQRETERETERESESERKCLHRLIQGYLCNITFNPAWIYKSGNGSQGEMEGKIHLQFL